MHIKITKKSVDSLPVSTKDQFYRDSELPGFGLKVTPAGKKVYLVEARAGKGRMAPVRRVTIGQHGPWTPEAARDRAKELLHALANGIDVVAERRKEGEAQQQDLAQVEEAKKRTFAAIMETYLAKRVRGKLAKDRQVEGSLNKHFTPHWKDRDIGTIKRADVMKVLGDMEAAGAAGAAQYALAVVRPLFEFAVNMELIPVNPAAGRNLLETKYKPRERALSRQELAAVWHATEATGYPFGPIVRLLILTAQRLEEVAGMEWRELDLDAGLWTIPKERAKMKRPQIVHLSPQAMAVLTQVREINFQLPLPEVVKITPFVFTTTLRTSVSGFSNAKESLDKALVRAGVVMPPWTLHDLRRTFSTMCAQMEVPQIYVEKILSHNPKELAGVAAIYNQYEYLPKRKEVLEMWGAAVAEMVG